VSKFGGVLFSPILLTAVACYAAGALKGQAFIQEPQYTPCTS